MTKELNVPTSRRRTQNKKAQDTATEWTDATSEEAEKAEAEKQAEKLRTLPDVAMSVKLPAAVHQAETSAAPLRNNFVKNEIVDLLSALNGFIPWPSYVVESVRAQINGAAPHAAGIDINKLDWLARTIIEKQKQQNHE